MLLNVLVDNHLIQLLLAADLFRLAVTQGDRTQILQGQLALLESLALATVEGGLSIVTDLTVFILLVDVGSDHQGTCEGIHTADVRDEDVLQIRRVATSLRIEVRTARSQATALQHH